MLLLHMVLYSLSNTPKPTWHPRKGHACLEKIFSQIEKKNFLRFQVQIRGILICLEKSGRLLDFWPMIELLQCKKRIKDIV